MRLADLVDTSQAVAAVSGRLEKIARLADLLRRGAPDEVEIAVSFLSGSARQGRLGIGGATIAAARDVPAALAPSLDLRGVDAAFGRIKTAVGPGSDRERARLLRDLLAGSTAAEQDFLTRLLFGELRHGAGEGVLLEAVARAAGVGSPAVRRAAMMAGDLGAVAAAALAGGEAALSRFAVQVHRPVQPMLADSADSAGEAMAHFGTAALELKIDGARIQVHKASDDVRIFSRQLSDVTPAVPEVVEVVRALPVADIVLDGEIVALRPDGRPLAFQETMRRFGRRLDVDRLRAERPLTPFFFDCLYVDGAAIVDEVQRRRFAALEAIVPPALIIPHTVVSTGAGADAFLDSAMRLGHEGIMAKALDAPYAAGSRGRAWIKVKPARTLDLVVLAAEWGHGRRRGWLSNLHLGARDPAGGAFVMLGKTFKGLTDEMLAWQTARLLALETGRDDCTVFVRPELVVEIAFNDVQASPRYPGGLALRFARVVRYREEKPASEADTIASVSAIHRSAAGLTFET
jgi:DNA ligase-1